jgi:hypothetical protein
MTYQTLLVYRCPGKHSVGGGTYDFAPAETKDELSKMLSKGWFKTLPEAIKGKEIVEDGPPTRAELETKAKELGLKFDGRTNDKKLALMIEEAL